jgi:hypothetical protein
MEARTAGGKVMVSTPYLELFLRASGEPGGARLESGRLLLGVGLVGEVAGVVTAGKGPSPLVGRLSLEVQPAGNAK